MRHRPVFEVSQSGSQVFYDARHRRWRTVAAVLLLILSGISVPLFAVAFRVSEAPALGLPNALGNKAENVAPDDSHPLSAVAPVPTQPPRSSRFRQPAAPAPVLTPIAYVPDAAVPPADAANTAPNLRRLAYLGTKDESSVASVRANVDAIDMVLVRGFRLTDAPGNVIDATQTDRDVIQTMAAARPGLRLMAVVGDQFEDSSDPSYLNPLITDRDTRKRLIDGLVAFTVANNFAGVDLAISDVDDQVMQRYEQFVGELHRAFAPRGLSVAVTVDLEDRSFRVGVLSRMADLVIIDASDMAVNPAFPAPLAGQASYVETLHERIAGADPAKIAAGIATYGYDWNLTRGTATEISSQAAMRLAAEAHVAIGFDRTELNPTFAYSDAGGDAHRVWYLDAVTAFNQIQGIRWLGIGAVAIGDLGTEEEGLWRLLQDGATLDGKTAAELADISFLRRIDQTGDGEIIEIEGHLAPGLRTTSFDPSTGLIIDEQVDVVPEVPTAVRSGGVKPRQIALTFDDGPDPASTDAILGILKRYNIKATFFLVGLNVMRYPDIARRIDAEGHDIGNHTFFHPDTTNISSLRYSLELNATQRVLESTIGRQTRLFRPPSGEGLESSSVAKTVALAAATAVGYYSVGFTIDPLDWEIHDRDAILHSVLDEAASENGGIVLLHDAGGDRRATVAALPEMIEKLTAEGFTFVTVSQLLGQTRDEVMPPAAETGIVDLLQAVGFAMLRWSQAVLTLAFTGAIALSVLRVAIIVVLALVNRRRPVEDPNYMPDVSVIVPAYNEEKVITKTIRSLLASTYPHLQILVIDDGSRDKTAEVVRERFAGDQRVQVFQKPNGGKASALNLGLALSDAEIIVALDADTVFRSDTIFHLTRPFIDPSVGAVAGNAKVGNRVNLMTRWQALEYIISQNLDRQAFELVNAISVVPGAVGAWRRSAVAEAGGFAPDTLAEDADLTMRISRAGYAVRNADRAIAMTEAPDTVRGFIGQRSRWSLGTLQAAWKNRDLLLRPTGGAVGMIVLPHILLFQFILPLLAPMADLFVLIALCGAALQTVQDSVHTIPGGVGLILKAYVVFLLVDFVVAFVAYLHEPREDRTLVVWLPLQRFFYRQLLYYVTLKSVVRALAGIPSGWNSIARKATVAGGLPTRPNPL